MTCSCPLTAYQLTKLAANGKRQIVFKRTTPDILNTLELPCGQCMECRLDKSLAWALRISNEASLYNKNCFITLTYSADHLPSDGSLNVKHWQDFMKRLRFHYRASKNIRFFHCGEYGERLGRPHYHACLLNFDFPDKYLYRMSDRGDPIFRSPTLEKLWPFGISEIGAVTFDSAAYCARYITKKITGPIAEDHYQGKKPEYTTMSRRPGIGAPWLARYKTDVYPKDYLTLRGGKKVSPPRFYDKQYEILEPLKYAKLERKRMHQRHKDDLDPQKQFERTYERRIVKSTVLQATVNSTLKRKLEKE